MTFADRYFRYLAGCDLDGAWEFLGALEGDELREAKAWFQRRHTGLLDRASADGRSGHLAEELRTRVSPAWVFSLGPVRLLAPKTAARSVLWRDFWDHQTTGATFLSQRLCEADRDWTAVFVEEASGLPVGDKGSTLAAILRSAATHHRLPCPTGATFLEHWSAGVPQMRWGRVGEPGRDPVGWLSADPFMPDLLFRHLASGHCGSSDFLPEVLPELVAQGVVDRDAIVEHILVQLTAPQRPGSQKILVAILMSLGLTAEEVAGGFAYLSSVIATSTGQVGKQLLPLAIGAVTGADDLAELAAVIAGRPEKAQKVTLLTALRSAELRERVGVEPIREALALLAVGDDTAFVNKVKAVLATLPGEPPAAENAPDTHDDRDTSWRLWAQDPTPSGSSYAHSPSMPWRAATWTNVVDVRVKSVVEQRDRLIDDVLTAMEAGSFDGATTLQELRAVLSAGRLSMPAAITVLRDVFLAGGLRQGYGVGLGLAEAALSSITRQSGIADLTRLLVEFAAEIPPAELPELPPRLAALAARPGGSKMQEEARALRDRFAGRPNRGATSVASSLPPRRELWDRRVEPGLGGIPLPRLDRRLVSELFGPTVSWQALRELTGGVAHPTSEVDAPPGACFCGPDLLLSAVVSTAAAEGVDRARDWLRRIQPAGYYGSWGGYLLALRTWADGGADPARFWQLALTARTARSLIQEFRDGDRQLMDPELARALTPWLTTWDAIALDGPAPDGGSYGLVLARSLDSAADRLEFLRGLEVLLLADRNAVVLATPVWADGTLDFDHLLRRLQAAEGRPVGPLDLVQALHRLRPCTPARVAELDELRASGGVWRTAPALTSPDGDESWDVLDLVRTWVAEGGLPPLDPIRGADGLWHTRAAAPVPWSRCAAAPAELRENHWSLSEHAEPVTMGRIFPLWPDRTCPAAGPGLYVNAHSFPALLSGSFGLPLHETFLSLLLCGITGRDASSLAAARMALRCQKVSAPTYSATVASRYRAGQLDVEILARATEAMFEQNCLAQFWQPSLAAADALCDVPGGPVTGLDRFLQVLTAYAHEVAEPVVTPVLHAFASTAGRTKLHHAARTLVQALDSGVNAQVAP